MNEGFKSSSIRLRPRAGRVAASLETRQAIDIITLLHGQAKARNATVIVASHDLRLGEFADRTLRLQDGMIG